MAWSVKDWDSHFENSESRKVKHPRWVPIPNRHDGKGYRRLLKHPRHVEIFCAWCLILQVASRMPVRGVLADEDGDLSPDDLADKTGFEPEIFDLALKVLSDNKIGWILDGRESRDAGMVSGYAGMSSGHAGLEGKGIEGEGRELSFVPPGFAGWWASWPKGERKVGKSKCLREWQRHGLESIAETVMRALDDAKASAGWQEQNGKFIPMPLTWLNRTPWETAPDERVSGAENGETYVVPPGSVTDALPAPEPYVGRMLE